MIDCTRLELRQLVADRWTDRLHNRASQRPARYGRCRAAHALVMAHAALGPWDLGTTILWREIVVDRQADRLAPCQSKWLLKRNRSELDLISNSPEFLFNICRI